MKYKVLDEDEYWDAKEEGRTEATMDMIRSFLSQGFPLDAIAKASGMSLDYIQSLSL